MNVYDFDNTIYRGDSTADFYLYCLKKHPKAITKLPKLIAGATRFYVLKKGTKTEFKEKMYDFLTCCDVENDVTAFWQDNIKNINLYEILTNPDIKPEVVKAIMIPVIKDRIQKTESYLENLKRDLETLEKK